VLARPSLAAALCQLVCAQAQGKNNNTLRLHALQGIHPPCNACLSVFRLAAVKAKPYGRYAALTEWATEEIRKARLTKK
jgi:hypothetical protein